VTTNLLERSLRREQMGRCRLEGIAIHRGVIQRRREGFRFRVRSPWRTSKEWNTWSESLGETGGKGTTKPW
jgi:hypothetical protein